MCCPQSGTGTRSKLFSVNALSVLLGKARRHPLSLEVTVKRGVQPGAGTSLAGLRQFALLFAGSDVTESRSAHSLLRTTYARDFPEIVVNIHEGSMISYGVIPKFCGFRKNAMPPCLAHSVEF